jgi:hypothetical protein
MTLSSVAIASNQCDLLGIVISPRNSLGFHAKNRNDGIATATVREERKKAGIAVIPGNGPSGVGNLDIRSPTQAGISKLNPAMRVANSLITPHVSIEFLVFM